MPTPVVMYLRLMNSMFTVLCAISILRRIYFSFDYGDYKLMGSSPEAQLVIKNGKAVVHPIAGTFKRTGDDELDQQSADRLLGDAKEKCRTCNAG